MNLILIHGLFCFFSFNFQKNCSCKHINVEVINRFEVRNVLVFTYLKLAPSMNLYGFYSIRLAALHSMVLGNHLLAHYHMRWWPTILHRQPLKCSTFETDPLSFTIYLFQTVSHLIETNLQMNRIIKNPFRLCFS